MERLPQCRACRDEGQWGPDSQPPVQHHTCATKGPRSERQIIAAIKQAAFDVHFSSAAQWPGGDYSAEAELEHLLYRLALLHKRK